MENKSEPEYQFGQVVYTVDPWPDLWAFYFIQDKEQKVVISKMVVVDFPGPEQQWLGAYTEKGERKEVRACLVGRTEEEAKQKAMKALDETQGQIAQIRSSYLKILNSGEYSTPSEREEEQKTEEKGSACSTLDLEKIHKMAEPLKDYLSEGGFSGTTIRVEYGRLVDITVHK